ncbi:MAG: response regulator transcription factor [Phycisphaerales bacterium]
MTTIHETIGVSEDTISMGSEEKSTATTRILVVDDHYIMRRGLCELLGQQPGFEVGAAVNNAQQAIEVAQHEPFDLAIVDVSLGEVDGIELTSKLKAEHPDLVVLILSMHDESLYAGRAAGAGASGFVPKQRAGDLLLPAIERVLKGEYYFSSL